MEYFIPIAKYTLVLMTAPIWWPFLKALWAELNDALAEEGGLMGSPPGPTKLEKLRREREERGDPLVHEPKFVGGRRQQARWSGQGAGSSGGAKARPPAKRKPGFRS